MGGATFLIGKPHLKQNQIEAEELLVPFNAWVGCKESFGNVGTREIVVLDRIRLTGCPLSTLRKGTLYVFKVINGFFYAIPRSYLFYFGVCE